ncbi:hypothetical protein [Actinoplanes utahensis]|uniref:hypothetical protein n=1 Tax=Actinoplanes utahensis TaxID=1869 RepID=UPI000B24CF74|nr:hypothetical protein [Actinoplanes utahensis]GIF30757.1 hypothetical protein Aut01nite_37430 [Actinoplanes utahensis]
MTELTALAAFAATTVPVPAERIPAAPARYLGRSAAPEEADPMTLTGRRFRKPDNGEPECLAALRSVGEPLAERLLGALERPVARHAWSTAPELVAGLPAAFSGRFGWGSVMGGYQSEATETPRLLDRLRPGLTERAMTLTRELAADPGVAPLMAVRVCGDEPAIAAAHGAVYLALAVTVAGAVIHQAHPVPVVDPVAATVGLGTGIAALLLQEAPLPAGYQEALLTKIRESYLMPRHSSGHLKIIGHQFGLTEGAFPRISDFSRNGLVAVGDGGVVVRTGIADGSARVDLQIIDAPSKDTAPEKGSPEDPDPGNTAPENAAAEKGSPEDPDPGNKAPEKAASENGSVEEPSPALDPGWDDVVEVSWRAAEGRASVTAPDGSSSGACSGRLLRGRATTGSGCTRGAGTRAWRVTG